MRFAKLAKQIFVIVLTAQLALSVQFRTMAQAEMIGTDAALSKYAAQADRQQLLSELQKQEVRDQIIAMGVDPAEAEKRLSALTDAEVASILGQIDEDSAGGNAIIGALVTIFVILLVTDLLCLTKVFSFTRCA